MTNTVYAVEFLPQPITGGVGGMDWYHCENDATARYRQLVEFGDPGSVSLHEIEVDAADTDAVTDLVRDYLDEPERPALLTSTWPVGDVPCVLVEQGNIHRAVWELRVQSLTELIDEVGGAAHDATWRAWNLPGTAVGDLYDGLCDTAAVSIGEDNCPTLVWRDSDEEMRRVHGAAVEPKFRDGHLVVIDALDQIAASLTAALPKSEPPSKQADTAPSSVLVNAHGVAARISSSSETTTADPAGVVVTCTVAGHPGVEVHAHSSTTVDGAVTVAIDAPEGTTIRFDVNDGEVATTTVGEHGHCNCRV